MKEMMMLMMIRDQNQINPDQEPITNTSSSTSWKLYENPYYYPKNKSNNHLNLHYQQHHQQHHQHHHHIHLPVSARQVASSFSDFTFFQSIMVSQLESAKSQIKQLKSELELERKLRKKVESLNKKLSKELTEQRKQKESLQCLCEELAEEIACDKAVIDEIKRNMEEERRMLRMSEVLREERVQMKLSEAKIVFEEKLLELEFLKIEKFRENSSNEEVGFCQKSSNLNLKSNNNNGGAMVRSTNHRKSSSSSCSESENPHIKRGIKGFVEFPRVVKAISSLRGRQLMGVSNKLENPQKSQLQFLLRRQKSSPFSRANNLFMA
ncbi:hypothetical protein MKW98_004867 [Papaver atlanticum]|uniref:Uncharacterized protein n=1 Tax=Papaver atlanticum TaxID=357466 RepID=A0AAD4RY53_9MAGN|nr:hypothetical protein MKW98_004867 [Papaver atlanticum]